jgi:hypothetical protein
VEEAVAAPLWVEVVVAAVPLWVAEVVAVVAAAPPSEVAVEEEVAVVPLWVAEEVVAATEVSGAWAPRFPSTVRSPPRARG